MKKLLLLFIALVSLEVNAQNGFSNFGTFDLYNFNEAWFFSAGAGTSIFLGDISPLPKLTLRKNSNEYKFSGMFRLGKKIIPALDINLELLKGNIGGKKEVDAGNVPMDMSFIGDYWGLTINARVDFLKLFPGTLGFPLSFYGRIGIGPLYYRALLTKLSTGGYLDSEGYSDFGNIKEKRQQTFVVPLGLGLSYRFSDNFRIEGGVDLYNASTDYLDAHHGIASNYNDKIFIISGTLVYSFDWDNWEAPHFHD